MYEALLLDALRMKTTLKKNMNVPQHFMGYFKLLGCREAIRIALQRVKQERLDFWRLLAIEPTGCRSRSDSSPSGLTE